MSARHSPEVNSMLKPEVAVLLREWFCGYHDNSLGASYVKLGFRYDFLIQCIRQELLFETAHYYWFFQYQLWIQEMPYLMSLLLISVWKYYIFVDFVIYQMNKYWLIWHIIRLSLESKLRIRNICYIYHLFLLGPIHPPASTFSDRPMSFGLCSHWLFT